MNHCWESLWRHLTINSVAKLYSPNEVPSTPGTNISTPPVKEYRRSAGEIKPNEDYLEYISIHRQQYNPVANWYKWQTHRTGKNKLHKQNDAAFGQHVRRTHGLHEQHLAEELHRHQTFPTQYTNGKKKTLCLDPSVPPMGDKKFDRLDPDEFTDLWTYWTECFPAHAYDINKE